jgi:hypothetical protein
MAYHGSTGSTLPRHHIQHLRTEDGSRYLEGPTRCSPRLERPGIAGAIAPSCDPKKSGSESSSVTWKRVSSPKRPSDLGFCAPSGTRTPNPLIKSQLLCQLS